MGEQNVIRLRGVTIYHTDDPFGSRSEKKLLQQGELILSDLNFDINAGEFVYLIGRVGSGKSSLLKTLYAELQLIEGEGYVAGFDLRKLKRREIPMLRRRIGIVFQDYQLLTDRNVFMNLYYVMKATGWKNESEIRKRIDEVLKVVSLEAKGYKMPFELSGGEQQRVCIARALINCPKLILADEPTGNLDEKNEKIVLDLFRQLHEQGTTIIVVTHDALVASCAQREIMLNHGVLVGEKWNDEDARKAYEAAGGKPASTGAQVEGAQNGETAIGFTDPTKAAKTGGEE